MIFFYFKKFIFYTFCIIFFIFLLTFFYISSLLFLYSSLNFFTSVLLSFCLSFSFSLIAFSFPSSLPLLSPFSFLSRVSYSCFFMRIDQLMVTDLSDICREYFSLSHQNLDLHFIASDFCDYLYLSTSHFFYQPIYVLCFPAKQTNTPPCLSRQPIVLPSVY